MAKEFKAEYKEERIKFRNEKNRLEAEIKKLKLIKNQAASATLIMAGKAATAHQRGLISLSNLIKGFIGKKK